MASLYQRTQSPYWWIKCRDAKAGSRTFGQTIRFSTHLRVGIGGDTRKARELCAKFTVEETQAPRDGKDESWGWVSDYLDLIYKGKTLARYRGVWQMIRMFIDEQKIDGPRQFTREHCFAYVIWRKKPAPKLGKYAVVHNTVITELRVLSAILNEAVERKLIEFNPAHRLGLGKEPPKLKPEYTNEHLALIAERIEAEPEPLKTFFRNTFNVARFQGCRFAETLVNPMEDVAIFNDDTGQIIFRIKGGKDHVAPLHPELIPLFRDLQRAQRTTICEVPRGPTRKWFDFLRRIGLVKALPGACFHSLRVTAVTRLARANVPEAKAMKFIGHASTTVHRTYQRLDLADAAECLPVLNSAGKHPVPETAGAPPAKHAPTTPGSSDR